MQELKARTKITNFQIFTGTEQNWRKNAHLTLIEHRMLKSFQNDAADFNCSLL